MNISVIVLPAVALSLFAASVPSDKANAGPELGTAAVHCGTERWPAKTLSDGTTVDFNNRSSTTVNHLRSMQRPSGVDNKSGPRTPEESRVYTIHALLQEYKREAGDHDFHIVISDFGGSPKDTMIAEIPDSQCEGVAGDGWTSQFTTMRADIERKFGTATGNLNKVDQEVTISGVLFFDFLHGQTGVAPNGVELHPVIALSFGAGSSIGPTPSPTPTPTAPMLGTLSQFDSEAAAQQHCPDDALVWLNTRTGLYHLKGHRYYGTTTHGAFVCEKEAIQAGYREGY